MWKYDERPLRGVATKRTTPLKLSSIFIICTRRPSSAASENTKLFCRPKMTLNVKGGTSRTFEILYQSEYYINYNLGINYININEHLFSHG